MPNPELETIYKNAQITTIERKLAKGEQLLPEELEFMEATENPFKEGSVVVVKSIELLIHKSKRIDISFGYDDTFFAPFTKAQKEFLGKNKIHFYLIVQKVKGQEVVVRSLMSPEGGHNMDFTISTNDLKQIT